MSSLTTDNNLSVDACLEEAEPHSTEHAESKHVRKLEYCDCVLLYATKDRKLAYCILEYLTNICLKDGKCPKVLLYQNTLFDPSKVNKPSEILAVSSVVFLILTENLKDDENAIYINQEIVAASRLEYKKNKNKKYRIFPLHTKPKGARDYEVPDGVKSVVDFEFDENCQYSHDRLKTFFEESRHIIYKDQTHRNLHIPKTDRMTASGHRTKKPRMTWPNDQKPFEQREDSRREGTDPMQSQSDLQYRDLSVDVPEDVDNRNLEPGDAVGIDSPPFPVAVFIGDKTILRCEDETGLVVKEEIHGPHKKLFVRKGDCEVYSAEERLKRARQYGNKTFNLVKKGCNLEFLCWVFTDLPIKEAARRGYKLDPSDD